MGTEQRLWALPGLCWLSQHSAAAVGREGLGVWAPDHYRQGLVQGSAHSVWKRVF